MTRPQKASGDKRSLIFKLRLTIAEKQKLLELAADAGLSPSDFARVMILNATPQGKKATPDRAILIRLQAELNMVGSNANQIARALNRRADSDSLTGVSMELVNEALYGIKLLTAQLAKELGHGD